MNCVVLVVDFEPRSAGATKALLEPRGCEVFVAGTTKDLESFLAREFPVLVVLEPMLPGLDGFRFIRALKARKGGRIPVVVTASRIFKGQRYKTMGREAGADLVLERPQDDGQLVAAVDKAIAQFRAEQAGTAAPVDTASMPAMARHTSGPVTAGNSQPGAVKVDFKAAAPVAVPAGGRDLSPAATVKMPAPGAAAQEPELDQLVDRMFESCFEKGPDTGAEAQASGGTAVAVATAEAPRAKKGGKVDSSTREMLSTLAEIENSLPQARGRKGGAAGREVETSVPLAPPPRSDDERSLDEVLEKITGQVPPAPAPRTQAAKAAPAPPPTSTASTGGFSGMLAESQKSAPNPMIKKVVIPAAAVVLVLAIGGFMLTGKKSAPAPTPAETPAATAPASAPPSTATAPAPTAAAPTPAPAPTAATTEAKAKDRKAKEEKAKPTTTTTAPVTTTAQAPAPAPAQPATPTPAPVATTAQATPAPAPVQATPTPEPAPVQQAPAPAPQPAAPVAAAPQRVAEPEGPPIPGVNGVSLPQIISRTEPSYPAVARSRNIKGMVVLRVQIHADGTVGDVSILRDIEGSGLGKAAASAVHNWRYKPSMQRGRPVEVTFTQTVTFN